MEQQLRENISADRLSANAIYRFAVLHQVQRYDQLV